MNKQPDRLETLAALCKQKLLADPHHPRAKRLARDIAVYQEARRIGEAVSDREPGDSAQRTGNRVSHQDGADAPEGAEGKEDR